MTAQPTRICILGGGFGGLYTAGRLSQLPWEKSHEPEILLVDRHDRFLFSPLLYELLTEELQTWEIAPPFAELLATYTAVRFIQATVADIDVDSKQVQLDNGQKLQADRLVLALGGETPLQMVPGSAEYAIPFRTIADAYRLAEKLRILEQSDAEKIRIAIVGAGYSGVELACKLADRLSMRGRVRLIEQGDMILRTKSEFNREAAMDALSARGVWTDLETTVQSIEPDSVSLVYKEQVDKIPVDVVLWTVGTRVPDVVRSLPLKQNQRQQLIATPTLQIIDHPDIFALGDLAECRDAVGQQVPATAQAALQQSDYTAWNIWASLTGRPLLPWRYQNLGEMMTLGIDNATLTGLGVKLDGPLAHLARRLIYLYRLPTFNHQVKVGFNWMTKPLQSALMEVLST
ncbi:MAG: NAD(P)/FAD-dependent oxidoreductase [Hormoscilla sp. GM7CHS1pb]|nr:NAD(P)/FAD-dependent oxidoreductase [Hormoscilla sp. GM7CHS1pb]